MSRNPFNQLFLGEKITPQEYVEIFSSELVALAQPIFERGNVIVSGVQGTGKTMLFKLLESEVRRAYVEAGRPLPVDSDTRKFVSGGVNLNSEKCNQFGRRRSPPFELAKERMFADFVNYKIVLRMITSIRSLAEVPELASAIEINDSDASWSKFARELAKNEAWLGGMDRLKDLPSFIETLQARERAYRRFLAYSDTELDERVAASLTQPGEPVCAAADALQAAGILTPDTEVFIHIDQYEELATIAEPGGDSADYRSVINAMLNRRDASVSYKIGTRGYAYREHLNIFGTNANIERDRDYKLVDLDAKLRGNEVSSANIFPNFAQNVFERRMNLYHNRNVARDGNTRIKDTLGSTLSYAEKAKTLAGTAPRGILKIEPEWTKEMIAGLYALADENPLDAKLAEIWLRQKKSREVIDRDTNVWGKDYWKKERRYVALIKIASAKRQRMIYSGEDDIVGLSGNNILSFLTICQHIWDAALQLRKNTVDPVEIPIRRDVQTIGVFQASRYALDRINNEYGRGGDRALFIGYVAAHLAESLSLDLKLSYPGHSGFSLTKEDLESDKEVDAFLKEAVDYGNLTYSEHTTKNRNRRQRVKFYLNPIYCPFVRLPFKREKEPKYVTCATIREWMTDARIKGMLPSSPRPAKPAQPSNLPLFDD